MGKLKLSFPSYQQPRMVTYGTGSLRALADCDKWESTAVFLSGTELVRTAVEACLRRKDRMLSEYQVIEKPAGEPTFDMIERGNSFLKTQDFVRIVAVGGGAVMDWCRLAWASAEGIFSFDNGRVELSGPTRKTPELWLVPTTCATGAEAATVAVFTADRKKVPVVSQHFLADRVILDGQFLKALEPPLVANFLCDALSHAIEAYISIVPCYLAKQAASAALWLILENFGKEKDASRNDRLMEAAYLGGLAASHCSVGVVHAFAHTMAYYGFSHASGNAMGLLAGISVNSNIPSMRELAIRCGASSVEELAEWIAPIVNSALTLQDPGELTRTIGDTLLRKEIIEKMEADVSVRTNPKSMGTTDYDRFLDDVLEKFPCQ